VVKLRHTSPPRAIVVKPARPRAKPPAPTRCIVCRSVLRADHASELVCDCHPREGYEPRIDSRLGERIVLLLFRAQGRTVNLCRALGAFPTKSNLRAVQDEVARLNAGGLVTIHGVPGWGYRLGAAASPERRTLRP